MDDQCVQKRKFSTRLVKKAEFKKQHLNCDFVLKVTFLRNYFNQLVLGAVNGIVESHPLRKKPDKFVDQKPTFQEEKILKKGCYFYLKCEELFLKPF